MYDDLKEAVENWRNSENGHKETREALIELLTIKLEDLNLTEMSDITGIKRTTLYYMIFGKGGKGGRQAA